MAGLSFSCLSIWLLGFVTDSQLRLCTGCTRVSYCFIFPVLSFYKILRTYLRDKVYINLNCPVCTLTMSVPGKRNRISDSQRTILETFYNEGMVGSGSIYKTKIDRAIDETGLTEAQVKVFLFNSI